MVISKGLLNRVGAAIDVPPRRSEVVVELRGRAWIECAVLGNEAPEASVPGEIVPSGEFYDYNAKYLSSGSETLIPAPITADLAEEVRRQSIIAFDTIDGSGLARVDFLLSSSGELFINGSTRARSRSALLEAGAPAASPLGVIDRMIALAISACSAAQRRMSAF